jgi:hypothetical protein
MAAGDYTQQVISYAYIQGRWYSFPSPFAAKLAVQRYNGNMESVRTERPTGVNIDTSLGWDLEGGKLPETILPAPGVTGDALWNPPLNPIIRATPVAEPVADPVVDPVADPVAEPVAEPVVDLWDDLDQDLLNLAKRYADAGMMGRAKAAFEQAGGTWAKDTHKRMAQERDQTGLYGGQFEFNWANRGITDAADLEKIKAWAKGGLFGRIKQFMESKKAGSYDKDVHTKLKAMTHRGKHDYIAPSTVTQDTPGAYLDTRTGKWRMPAPDGTTPGKKEVHVYDPLKMKGTRQEIGGKFKTGQARQDANTWRQQHMAAAEKKHGIKRDAAGKIINSSKANQQAWDAYIAQRNKIAGRHRGMIGAGKKTLKSGEVIGW